jgi:hypothetical protein
MIKVTHEFNAISDMIAFYAAIDRANIANIPATILHNQPTDAGNSTAASHDDDGPANMNAPNTDTAGMPWDERIHSTKKGLNADGTWRKRRGVDAAFITQIETELRARGAQQSGMYMPPGPSAGYVQAGSPSQPGPGPVMNYQQPPGPGPVMMQPSPGNQYAPTVNYAPPGPIQQQGMDFNAFMSHLMQRMQQRGPDGQPFIEHNYLITVVQKVNSAFGKQYQAITDIGNEPQILSYAQQLIAADGRWQ